ncbi:MAG TPA: histidine kinase dimerization/phospho-acceptor domain-containing protein [Gemmatimonadaceae bacterium]|nr:histidine kinase dimerization/phospho-acceptor domain-containing protein [Gemmatimonadaceae bacterium]
MSTIAPALPPAAEIDTALLGTLLTAETVRDGASAMLNIVSPLFDDTPCALAVRDRDGLTLHTLAELGQPTAWPTRLEPQFALGAQHGVDPSTGVMVAPLRADGRVVGVLMLGDPTRVATSLRDDTVRNALATVAAVLRVLLARNESALHSRAESLRSIDAIVDGMAHQMSNPLTGASAIAQLLAEDLQDEGQLAAIAQIRHELGRAFVVLNDMLDFQRDTRAQDGILDFNAIAERIVRFRGYAIREQGIALDVETSPAFLPVRAEARSLEHAMLLTMRFAEQRSHGTVNRRIAVRVSELPNAELCVDITDSGAGDTPSAIPAFFDTPLSARARESTTQMPDLGLVDSLLRGCGGRLEIRGSKADGTTYSLVLPRAYTSPSSAGRNSK